MTADRGAYCSEGEPPTRSAALAGSGGPSRWDARVAGNSDGWSPATPYRGGDEARSEERSSAGTTTLTWHRGSGFDRAAHAYAPIPGRFTGSWRAKDGSHRLAFEQAGPERPPSLTVGTLTGRRCTGRAVARASGDDAVTFGSFTVEKGAKTRNRPPPSFDTRFTAHSADGPLRLVRAGAHRGQLDGYVRADG